VSAAVADKPFLSLGEAATALGCKDWHLHQLFRRGLVDEPPRAGRRRLISREDLPALRAALVLAGYAPARGHA
jgi:hypothetical protein